MLQDHMARRLPHFATQVAIFHFDHGLVGLVLTFHASTAPVYGWARRRRRHV